MKIAILAAVVIFVIGAFVVYKATRPDMFNDPKNFTNGYYTGPADQTRIPYNNGFYSGPYNDNLPVIDPKAK